MHSPKHCLPGSGWEISGDPHDVNSCSGYDATINRNVIQRDTDRMLVFYWYQSPDRVFASEYKGKFSWFGTEYRGVTQADRSSA